MLRGLLLAKGCGAPHVVRIAAFIFMPSLLRPGDDCDGCSRIMPNEFAGRVRSATRSLGARPTTCHEQPINRREPPARVQAWRREKLGSSVAWADSPWLVMNDRLQRCPVEADRMLGEELDAGRKHRSMLRVVDEDVA